jgi:ribonuclease BN (tRNA processing enzyme)
MNQIATFDRAGELRAPLPPATHDPSRPPNLHLSGTEAGQAAAQAGVAELLLTHIPPWTSREDVISEAKAEFDGPVHAVVCGESFPVTRH